MATTAQEMKLFSVDELKHRATSLREELFHLRIKARTGTLESTAQLPKLRKELARVLTILRQVEASK